MSLSKDLADARKSLADAATSISVVSHRLIRDGQLDTAEYHHLVSALKYIGAADYLVRQSPSKSFRESQILSVPAA